MAGDWIPVREDIHGDPAVLEISDLTNLDEDSVVGKLIRVWTWVSRNCHAPTVTGVGQKSLARAANVPEDFVDAMRIVGWLEFSVEGERPVLVVPNFDRWLSHSGKSRIQANRRKAASRSRHASVTQESRNGHGRSVTKTGTTEQNRTEQSKEKPTKRKSKPDPRREILEAASDQVRSILENDDDLLSTLAEWYRYKTERGEGYKPTGLRAMVSQMVNFSKAHGAGRLKVATDRAMASNWKGWNHDLDGGDRGSDLDLPPEMESPR